MLRGATVSKAFVLRERAIVTKTSTSDENVILLWRRRQRKKRLQIFDIAIIQKPYTPDKPTAPNR